MLCTSYTLFVLTQLPGKAVVLIGSAQILLAFTTWSFSSVQTPKRLKFDSTSSWQVSVDSERTRNLGKKLTQKRVLRAYVVCLRELSSSVGKDTSRGKVLCTCGSIKVLKELWGCFPRFIIGDTRHGGRRWCQRGHFVYKERGIYFHKDKVGQ